MADTIRLDGIKKMLLTAVEAIRENHEELSALDAATGDGDHGVAMLGAMKVVEKSVNEQEGDDVKAFFKTTGWGIMGIGGGSTSTLLGSLIMGMRNGVEDGATDFDAKGVATFVEGGLAMVQKQTKAAVGDKTMMDGLIPAVEALRAAADEGKSVTDAMAAAADAASKGAAATLDMQAKFGRARNLGERTVGHIDPGATSMSLIFKAFADAVA